jgi:hypothetical protein
VTDISLREMEVGRNGFAGLTSNGTRLTVLGISKQDQDSVQLAGNSVRSFSR